MKKASRIKSIIESSRKVRILILASAAVIALCGVLYLYYHHPYNYPLTCVFYMATGLYCPGCGAGRACYSILHLHIKDAFCFNPLMTILLPFIGLYLAVRAVDWAITGGNHVDRKISVKLLVIILIIVIIYGILRNIPVYPFTLLAPGGLKQILI